MILFLFPICDKKPIKEYITLEPIHVLSGESVLLVLAYCDPEKQTTTYGHMQVLANLFFIDFSYEMGAVMSSEICLKQVKFPTVLLH